MYEFKTRQSKTMLLYHLSLQSAESKDCFFLLLTFSGLENIFFNVICFHFSIHTFSNTRSYGPPVKLHIATKVRKNEHTNFRLIYVLIREEEKKVAREAVSAQKSRTANYEGL